MYFTGCEGRARGSGSQATHTRAPPTLRMPRRPAPPCAAGTPLQRGLLLNASRAGQALSGHAQQRLQHLPPPHLYPSLLLLPLLFPLLLLFASPPPPTRLLPTPLHPQPRSSPGNQVPYGKGCTTKAPPPCGLVGRAAPPVRTAGRGSASRSPRPPAPRPPPAKHHLL